MARRTRLTTGLRLAALLAAVLLLHGLALQWLGRQLEPISALRPLAVPMFTRLLKPEAPAVRPAAPPPAAAPAPRRAAITSLAKRAPPVAQKPAEAASAPTAMTPEPAPGAEAQSPQLAESTPAITATATVGMATTTTTTISASANPAPAVVESAAAVSPAAALDSWPADTRVNYRLGGHFRGELHGSAAVRWQREDNRYQTRVDIDLTLLASLVLTSQGEVTQQGLVPRVYEELRRSGPRTARLGEESITLNDGRRLPRPPGVQDVASQFVELSHRFATGRDVLEVGRNVSLWLARPGGVDLWTYDIVAKQLLQTPELGEVEAFHLKPRPIANPRGNITAEMWFAPSLQYLPVRIRVNMGDQAHVDLIVTKIEQR